MTKNSQNKRIFVLRLLKPISNFEFSAKFIIVYESQFLKTENKIPDSERQLT